MQQPPRNRSTGIFTRNELFHSITQGIVIAAGVLMLYCYFMNSGAGIEQTRNIVFTTLILSNIFLTFANRSLSKSIYHTIRYKNSLAPLIIVISVLFLVALQFVPAIRSLFQLSPLSAGQFLLSFFVAFVGVMWFEVYKVVFPKI
jgi:Ca2+-transporting ATPase